MTDQLNGLRFDIYERVHLPDEVAAIEELEEIELVPHMQAIPQEDQVTLRGHLLLTGIYRSQGADGVSQLEHWIPVEISLPLSRVERVEDLTVEIDNFDIDLLSTRSLNVTGVLALRGLQMYAAQAPVWRDDSFTVVHQATAGPEPDADAAASERNDDAPQPYAYAATPADEPPAEAGEAAAEQEDTGFFATSDVPPLAEPVVAREPTNGWMSFFQNGQAETAKQPNAAAETSDGEGDAVSSAPRYDSAADSEEAFGGEGYALAEPEPQGAAVEPASESWGDISGRRAPVPAAEIHPDPEPVPDPGPVEAAEAVEMKIALGAKAMEAPSRTASGVGLLSQIGEKAAIREAEQRANQAAVTQAEEAEPSEPSRATTGDELEWTRLFLAKGAEDQSFRKVRICIVQRDETLESISARYNVQSRELQLHNRLTDPYLTEGQVLYIP